MPAYEFKCNKCKKTFTITMSISEYEKRKSFSCIHCKNRSVKRIFSNFTAVTSKKS